ncbi:MAG TPA: hypothetical protein VJI73_02595 [Candidatus Paceibacterota bacterium]
MIAMLVFFASGSLTTPAIADGIPKGCYSYEQDSDMGWKTCKERLKAERVAKKAREEANEAADKIARHDRELEQKRELEEAKEVARFARDEARERADAAKHKRDLRKVAEKLAKETACARDAELRELAIARFRASLEEADCVVVEASSGSSWSRNMMVSWVTDILGAKRGYTVISTTGRCESSRLLRISTHEFWIYQWGACARADLYVRWDNEPQAFLWGWGASCEADDAYYPRNYSKTDEVRRSEALKAAYGRLR